MIFRAPVQGRMAVTHSAILDGVTLNGQSLSDAATFRTKNGAQPLTTLKWGELKAEYPTTTVIEFWRPPNP